MVLKCASFYFLFGDVNTFKQKDKVSLLTFIVIYFSVFSSHLKIVPDNHEQPGAFMSILDGKKHLVAVY